MPARDYVVIGGAVLELLGIRNTNDVDLVVSGSAYHRLRAKKWKEYVQDDGKTIIVHPGYRIMQRWMGQSLPDLQKSAQTVDGIPLIGLDDLVNCKILLGRKKDLEDVIRIKAYESSPNRPKGWLAAAPA